MPRMPAAPIVCTSAAYASSGCDLRCCSSCATIGCGNAITLQAHAYMCEKTKLKTKLQLATIHAAEAAVLMFALALKTAP
jgi:hypothetical protein